MKLRAYLRCALLLAAGLAARGQQIELQSPRDFQVFQRQTKPAGVILASGHTATDCDAVEARANGEWQPLTLDRVSGDFHGQLPTAAGGWYKFELRVLKAGRTVASLEVPHVGVGEVFVVAGQSNATNYGEVRQQTRSGMVAAWSSGGWSLANDPQPGIQDGSTNGSFIPAFGDALFEKYRVPIGVAAVGHGSTSVRQWLPKGERFQTPPTIGKFVHAVDSGGWECDGTLFDGMMKAISQLGSGGFRALLWHQGESDAYQPPGHEMTGDLYARLLTHIIQTSRVQAGWDFPWFVAQVSYHNPGDTSCAEIRDAQKSVWQSGVALQGPDTDQLTGANRQNGGQGVHFSDQGLQAHGRLWADKVSAYLDKVLR